MSWRFVWRVVRYYNNHFFALPDDFKGYFCVFVTEFLGIVLVLLQEIPLLMNLRGVIWFLWQLDLTRLM